MRHLSKHPFDEPLVELHEALTEQQEPLTEPHEPLIEQHEPLVELLADPLNQTKGLAVEAVAALCR